MDSDRYFHIAPRGSAEVKATMEYAASIAETWLGHDFAHCSS